VSAFSKLYFEEVRIAVLKEGFGKNDVKLFNTIHLPCGCFSYVSFYLSPNAALYLHNIEHVSAELSSHRQGVNHCGQQAACSKSLNGNYTYAAVCIFSYICRFKIIKHYVRKIFKDKV
jgi:hypothetical protein